MLQPVGGSPELDSRGFCTWEEAAIEFGKGSSRQRELVCSGIGRKRC